MLKRPKPAKTAKPVTYELVPPDSDLGVPIYERLDRLLEEHHRDLLNNAARIAIAWCTSWRPDVDGRLTLGKCKKATALDRELAPWDFVILLNRTAWFHAEMTEQKRLAILDHELCHAEVSYDENGEPKVDAKGRTIFRIRKHDLEEFRDVVARHGCYKADIESFMQAVHRAEAGAHGWVGYTRLQESLRAIGLDVPARVIATWPEDERREVMTWALLRQDADVKVNVATSQTMPACLAVATQGVSHA